MLGVPVPDKAGFPPLSHDGQKAVAAIDCPIYFVPAEFFQSIIFC